MNIYQKMWAYKTTYFCGRPNEMLTEQVQPSCTSLSLSPFKRQCFSDVIFDSETSEWTLHQVLTRTGLYPLVVFMVFATLKQKCITAAPGKVLKIT